MEESFHPDFLEDHSDAAEELPTDMLIPKGPESQTNVFFDADHGQDKKARRSMTGIAIAVGRTPVEWISKRQGCTAISACTAEFVAMRQATEHAIASRCAMQCLGIPMTEPTNLFGNDSGVMQNTSILDSELKKKHVAISCHCVREAIAAKVLNAVWIKTFENNADIFTKALGKNVFHNLNSELMV